MGDTVAPDKASYHDELMLLFDDKHWDNDLVMKFWTEKFALDIERVDEWAWNQLNSVILPRFCEVKDSAFPSSTTATARRTFHSAINTQTFDTRHQVSHI